MQGEAEAEEAAAEASAPASVPEAAAGQHKEGKQDSFAGPGLGLVQGPEYSPRRCCCCLDLDHFVVDCPGLPGRDPRGL